MRTWPIFLPGAGISRQASAAATTVDGSLMGMGRIPGNLPIELIADYMNEYPSAATTTLTRSWTPSRTTLRPIKGESAWGYTPAYFLSATVQPAPQLRRALPRQGRSDQPGHQPYSGRPSPAAKTAFDAVYADTLYTEYQNRRIDDDSCTLAALHTAFAGKTVLVLAPGASLAAEEGRAAVAAAEADVTSFGQLRAGLCEAGLCVFHQRKRFDVDLPPTPAR